MMSCQLVADPQFRRVDLQNLSEALVAEESCPTILPWDQEPTSSVDRVGPHQLDEVR